MANLAILGHATRGEEVIETLKMLGGKNDYHCCGVFINKIYFINENGYIESCDRMLHLDYLQLTLEGFLKKFPHKVGDKVVYKIYGIHAKIKAMLWNAEKEQVFYRLEYKKLFVATADELKPYKEETMEESNKITFDFNAQCCDIMNDIIKKDMEEIIKIDIPKGYEFAGVDDDKQQVVFTKIQPEYPKTYKECCKVLDIQSDWHLTFELNNPASCDLCVNKEMEYVFKLEAFRKLLICRDAYWKIAGDWKYDVNKIEEYFCIANNYGCIVKEHYMEFNHILAFPTEEIRNSFYGNFIELIEECKEFL